MNNRDDAQRGKAATVSARGGIIFVIPGFILGKIAGTTWGDEAAMHRHDASIRRVYSSS